MGGFKNGSAIADVGPWCHAKAPHHRCSSIGDVVTIEIKGCQHRIFLGPGLDLLKDAIGDSIIYQHHFTPFAIAMAGANSC